MRIEALESWLVYQINELCYNLLGKLKELYDADHLSEFG